MAEKQIAASEQKATPPEETASKKAASKKAANDKQSPETVKKPQQQKTPASRNIFQRMLAATTDINRVAKNLKVDISKNQSYKAVSEADVLEAVKPIEAENGIYSYPYSREIIKDETYTSTSEYDGRKSEKNTFFLRVKTVYRFVNVENPTDYIDITTYGDGVDTQDKAPGKAMTYADKYALLKAYKIQTGEDPDANPSGNLNKKNKPVEKPTPEQLKEAQDLKLDLNKVAAYWKKSVDEISKDDLAKSIQMQKDAIAKLKAKKAAQKAEEQSAQQQADSKAEDAQ